MIVDQQCTTRQERLNLDFRTNSRELQSVNGFGLDAQNMLDLLCQFDLYGVWKLDVTTGIVLWSDDVYRIHNMERTENEINAEEAISKYHPEDQQYLPTLIEEAIKRKSGYRFVLRLDDGEGQYKLVKSSARYQEDLNGNPQLIGLFSQFQPAIRSLAALAKVDA